MTGMTSMTRSMRPSTLETLGLGSVLEAFKKGQLPSKTEDLVGRVFGPADNRGCMIISGANGIVGAGKTMQLGSRLEPHGVRIVALDLPGSPDGIGAKYPALRGAFGAVGADRIMANIIRLSYDGSRPPAELKRLNPRFLLEAVPEVLEIKKAHYEAFRKAYPEIQIRSVTSGFPSSVLGVGIAHPAFPHEINKVWEIVEREPSAVTKLLWALGMIPIPVSDDWSFVLDVLFCGVTLAATRYHDRSNMPYWKIDKLVRKLVGPNPFRAHDSIGARGANFLTWSCLHHLAWKYGEVFEPTPQLVAHKSTGAEWYPPDHFRPLVDWSLEAGEEEEFGNLILGPLFQMTSLMLHEKRSHLSHLNIIGELCAQFRRGILAVMRAEGIDAVIRSVEAYHAIHPEAAKSAWHPEAFEAMEAPGWQQLYVNAECDREVGVITLGRESYNADVDAELNRAIDWLKARNVESVIITGDFHLTGQLVGADTSEFFPALDDEEAGARIAREWSRTARRLNDEFSVSIGVINGKRCLGGMLELLVHCHVVMATGEATLGMPEVTLPVVPGMEGCHWAFRKASPEHWPKLLRLLLSGEPVKASTAVGWLVDHAGTTEEVLAAAWSTATGKSGGIRARELQKGPLSEVLSEVGDLPAPDSPAAEKARRAIVECVRASCGATLPEAVAVQAAHSARFMLSPECRGGRVGAERNRTMNV